MRTLAVPALATLSFLLVACGQELPGGIKLPDINSQLGLSQTENDPSVEKITPDATIPIRLTSNKPETTFTVNGKPLNPAKSVRVLVPRTRLVITAQAPCYRTLTQTVNEDAFGRGSEIVYAYGVWDLLPGARRANCP